MNTMYRKRKNGYETVKGEFEQKQSTSILMNNNFKTEQSILNMQDLVLKKLWKGGDEPIRAAMDQIAVSDWPKDRGRIMEAPQNVFDRMPKALLHVHGTVGLSVDELYDVIEGLNKVNAGQEDALIGFVENAKDSETPGKLMYLMYKSQYDKMADKEKLKGCDFMPFDRDKHKSELKFETIPDPRTSWKEFGAIFQKLEPLFKIKEFYMEYFNRFFKTCMENHIFYIELRIGFEELVPLDVWSPEVHMTALQKGFRLEDYFYHREMMIRAEPDKPDVSFLEAIYVAAEKNHYIKDGQYNVKIILTANRNKMGDKGIDICKKADTAIAIKNGIRKNGGVINGATEHLENMIIGFDLVNQEDDGKSNGAGNETDTVSTILYGEFGNDPNGEPLNYKNEKILENLKDNNRADLIRYFLHDGESKLKIENKTDNAVTGPICSRHRIGHGFKMGTEQNFCMLEGAVSKDSSANADQERRAGNLVCDYILFGNSNDVKRQNTADGPADEQPGCYPVKEQVKDTGSKYVRNDIIPEPVLELCPISNYMLNYVQDISAHPAINLMEAGIFAVICNDDPQIFDNPGLSCDYAIMYTGLKRHFERAQEQEEPQKPEEPSKKAFAYLKLSSFLGFFYQEMSKHYYVDEVKKGQKIFKVNDRIRVGEKEGIEGEAEVYDKAVAAFKVQWESFGKINENSR